MGVITALGTSDENGVFTIYMIKPKSMLLRFFGALPEKDIISFQVLQSKTRKHQSGTVSVYEIAFEMQKTIVFIRF